MQKITKHKIEFFRANNKQSKIPVKAMLYRYHKSNKQMYSMNDIEKIVNDVRSNFKKAKKTGYVQLNLKTDEGYFPSKHFEFGLNKVNLNSHMIEYADELMEDGNRNPFSNKSIKTIRSFSFFIVDETSKKSGGCDGENNNCLWKCLMKSNIDKWTQPSFLKNYLHLKPKDMIHISKLECVENACNVGIYVNGDEERKPNKEFQRNIYLTLKDSHYKINHTDGFKMRNLTKSFKERKIVLFKKEKENYIVFDGEEKQCENLDNYNINEYIKIKFSDAKKVSNCKTFQTVYEWIKDQFDSVKDVSGGKINMYKSGWIGDTVLHHITYELNKQHVEIEQITIKESEWIENATRGGYIFCSNGEYENVYSYDQKSSYPSFLQSQHFNIPIKKGEFKTIIQENFDKCKNGSYSFGIYRCVVEEGNKKFKYNNSNFYTHFDLSVAASLNLKVQMVDDDEPNFLAYSSKEKATISSSVMFGNYINWVYKLKCDYPSIGMLKLLLSSIWGVLSQKFTKTFYCDVKENIRSEIPENQTISTMSYANKQVKIITSVDEKLYRTNLARLKPFLLSKQRQYMFQEVISKYSDNIIEMRIDGFLSTRKLPFSEDGKIGDIIFKNKYSQVNIKNINSIQKMI